MALYSRESCCCCCSRLPALVLSCWLDAIRRGAILDWSGRYMLYHSVVYTYTVTELILTNFSYNFIIMLCVSFSSFRLFFLFLWRFPSWSSVFRTVVRYATLSLLLCFSCLTRLMATFARRLFSSSVRWFIRVLTFLFNCWLLTERGLELSKCK